MNSPRPSRSRPPRQLAVTWKDCVWFPPVLAERANRPSRGRRPVTWPVQIITDPTVCRARTIDPIKV